MIQTGVSTTKTPKKPYGKNEDHSLANVRKLRKKTSALSIFRGAGVCPFLTLNLTAFLGTAGDSWGSMDRTGGRVICMGKTQMICIVPVGRTRHSHGLSADDWGLQSPKRNAR